MDCVVVCCCDQTYFPMVKGLILSINEAGPLPDGMAIGFLDLGLDADSLRWMDVQGVIVRKLAESTMGSLSDPALGYRRASTCRPFLPLLFPEARVLIWMDSDMWVQDTSILAIVRKLALEREHDLVIAPECHYSYTYINEYPDDRRREMHSYYTPISGVVVADRLSRLPTLNAGFFAMSAKNELWEPWRQEIRRVFCSGDNSFHSMVWHMADQITLNVIARGTGRVTLLDPLYNYMCMWTAPIRDDAGIVRIALPPHLPVGVLHLAGGWKQYGERYLEQGLFYRRGDYLEDSDLRILFAAGRHVFEFRSAEGT